MSNAPLDVIAQEPDGRDLAVGRLTFVENRVDPNNSLVGFRASFDNATEVLQPGRTVNVRILGYAAFGRIIP
jgi:multidrug efflux pump subunit AcrA (membrane-fusion protein)